MCPINYSDAGKIAMPKSTSDGLKKNLMGRGLHGHLKRNVISLVLIGEWRKQMPVRNALQMHVVIVVAVCLVSLLSNNVIKKCVHSHIHTSK